MAQKAKKTRTKKTVAKKTATAKKMTAAPKMAAAKKTASKKSVKKVIKKPAAKKASPTGTYKTQTTTPGQTFGAKTINNEAMESMMKQGTTQFDKFAQDATGFGRENVEAFMKSGTIFAKGFEDLFRTSMTLAQDSAEKQAQFVQEALAVKSLNEFADVQNKIAQASFDDFMASATKMSELGTKLLTEASEPINKQVNKVKKAA